jgi:hypothetical protein
MVVVFAAALSSQREIVFARAQDPMPMLSLLIFLVSSS